MKTSFIQIESTNSEDFKKEIISGVLNALKNFASNGQNDENDQLLTREETAKLLCISLVTLWTWTKEDLIPAYKIGNKVRYKKSEILKSLVKKNKF